MKTWFVLLLIAFALIAGYKFSGYQHQLSESNADKERLTNVLARSRATETSELKVIKPAAKLVSNEASATLSDTSKAKSGVMNAAPVAENAQIMAPEVFYTRTEGSLNMFFALPPNSERFVLDSVKCENGYCEVTGEYNGSETELSRVIEALEQEPWWEFGSPIITTQVAQRGLKLNVSFAASHSPNARVRYRNSTQVDLHSQLASAG